MSPRIGLDQEKVVRTAAEIADEQGVNQISLASLARRLNVKTPSLYNHINGMEGLKRSLAIYGLEELLNKVQQEIAGAEKVENIKKLAKGYVDFARLRPGLYELTLQAPDTNDEEYKNAGKAIVDLLLNVLQDFGLKDESAIHAVRGFRSMMHGFVSLEQNKGFGLPLELDVTLQLLIESFICGLSVYQTKS